MMTLTFIISNAWVSNPFLRIPDSTRGGRGSGLRFRNARGGWPAGLAPAGRAGLAEPAPGGQHKDRGREGGQFLNSLVTLECLNLVDSQKTGQLEPKIYESPSHFSAAMNDVPENSASVFVDCSESSCVETFLNDQKNARALLRAQSVVFYKCRPGRRARLSSRCGTSGSESWALGMGRTIRNYFGSRTSGLG